MSAAVEEIPYEELKIGDLIGQGFFGSVFKADWGNLQIAVKKIRPGCQHNQIEREVRQLSRVSHENIVQLHGITRHEDTFHLLMEYVDGGNLDSFLTADSKPSYTLAHAFNWAFQIAQGLAYLHARKPNAVIHRDIKPLNSLIYQKGLRLKICDFGTVVDLSKSMTVDVGTCRYKAPEVLRGRHYNEKCDVHSWAITFWEILSRKTPLEEHRGTYALKLAINGGDRPSFEDIMPGCPGDIISILSACWNVDPQKRHSMELVTYIMRKFVSEAGPIDPIDFQWPTL